jgi:hypothetical protein
MKRSQLYSPAFALLAFTLLAVTVALAQSGGAYNLSWNTFDGGGATFSTGGVYSLGGTAGQPEAGSMNGGVYALTGGFWQAGASATTSVNLAGFKARIGKAGDVVLRWKTTTEAQTAGFNIWRKTGTKKGESKNRWVQLNAQFIQAKHPGGAAGENYRFKDKSVKRGKKYQYKIEVHGLDGHTEWTKVVQVKTQK